MIYPRFISEDDYIGICAPSAGIGSKLESFELSIDTLYEAGFNTFVPSIKLIASKETSSSS